MAGALRGEHRMAARCLCEMKSLVLLVCLAASTAGAAEKEPSGYSADLYPVVRHAVAQVCRGMWGSEPEPPKSFVMDTLSMFRFQRVDLDGDGQEEVIATTARLPEVPNGDIFVFQRGKPGWETIGAFDGYGGYVVTDEIVNGYRTIRTRHLDDPSSPTVSSHPVTYIYRAGRFEASKAEERLRDASRN